MTTTETQTPRARPDEIPAHLVGALIPQNLAGARWAIAWLLRAFARRVPAETASQRDRRRNLGKELADALAPLAVSERSALGFFRALCSRWDVDPTGADSGFALEAWTPRGRIRWDRLLARVSMGHLRINIHENPAFFAQFAVTYNATEEEDAADEALLAAYASETIERTEPAPYVESTIRTVIPRAYSTVIVNQSDLHHGADEKHGNVALFRRKKTWDQVAGEWAMIPFVSGNAVRGVLRDIAANRVLSLVGLTTKDIAPSVAQSLFAGGTIKSGADTSKVDNRLRSRLRSLLPMWDLFAGCMNDQMMAGRLRVADMIPVCRETAWKARDHIAPGTDMVRFRDSLPEAQELTTLRLLTRMTHREFGDDDGVQMLVNTELAVEGRQWLHHILVHGLDGVSTRLLSCLSDVLCEHAETGGFIGAGGARGYGSTAFAPYATGGAQPLPTPDEYIDFMQSNAREVRELILELGGAGKGAAQGSSGEGAESEASAAGEPKSKRAGKATTKALKAAMEQRSKDEEAAASEAAAKKEAAEVAAAVQGSLL